MPANRQTLALVVLALALVVSGCQAPGTDLNTTTTTDNETPSPASNETSQNSSENQSDPLPITNPTNITVEGGELRTNPGLVYDRLRVLLETETPAPDRIRVFNSTADLAELLPSSGAPSQSRFFTVIGFETGDVAGNTFVDRVGNGFTLGSGTVALSIQPNATRDEEEMLVAHELAHYIQFQNDRQIGLTETVATETVDGRYVTRSLVEGTAVYTTDQYLREFGENGTLNSPYYDDEQAAYPPGHIRRWANSQYQIGARYVTRRLDSSSEVGSIYEQPPTQSRQLFDPDASPAPSLSVSSTIERDDISTNRLGAAVVRYGLESHIPPDRAREVAEGLGTDSLVQFRSDRDVYGNFAWSTRWENSSTADAFTEAISEYYDARGNRTDNGWSLDEPSLELQLRRPTPETVVLLAGSESFLVETAVRGSEGDIVLEPV